ncbi:MAG: SLC13 family permease [Hyphomicrobiales bacterium]|nr:SLC13 family permease [Hyphomicrobiales bacterium]
MELFASLTASAHMWFVLLLVLGAVFAYASEKISLEVASLVILTILMLVFHLFPYVGPDGEPILNNDMLLSGFATPALITVLCLLILGQAVVQTGALNEVANLILKLGRNNKVISVTVTLLIVISISGFLNNTPVVVIFIPIMAAIAKGLNISTSKVMIPLSFASILGGMTTLIGSSTNLLVAGIVRKLGYAPLGIFDIFYPGIVLALVGLLYLIVVIPFLLKPRQSLAKELAGEAVDRQFVAQIEVTPDSEFINQALNNGCLKDFPELEVRMIQRGEHAFLPPYEEDIKLKSRDILIASAPRKALLAFFSKSQSGRERPLALVEEIHGDEAGINLEQDVQIAEIVVAPASRVIGQNLEQLGFHRQYHCVVLGIQRQSRMIRTKMSETRLAAGDVLLVMGKSEDLLALQEKKDFLLLEWSAGEIHWGKKGRIASMIFVGVVGLAAFKVAPIVITSLAGVAAVIMTRCVTLRQAARAIDMKILLVIGTSIALGIAMQETGGAALIARTFVEIMHGASPMVVMAGMFVVVAAITNVLSNNASAVLFTPIAINIAEQLGVDIRAFIFAVIFACNCSFATPIGYQTNLMVMGPGHYKFQDFLKTGIPLTILIAVTYIIFAKMVFGL